MGSKSKWGVISYSRMGIIRKTTKISHPNLWWTHKWPMIHPQITNSSSNINPLNYITHNLNVLCLAMLTIFFASPPGCWHGELSMRGLGRSHRRFWLKTHDETWANTPLWWLWYQTPERDHERLWHNGYPLVNVYIAIENGHRNSGFSH